MVYDREKLRRTVAQLADLERHKADLERRRDTLIREAFAYGIRPRDIITDAGVSKARVYQIRNEP